MTPSFRFFLAAATLPLLALAACKNDKSRIADTGIVVEVSSDLAVPDNIDKVRLIVTNQQGTPLVDRTVPIGPGTGRSLPLREGLYPKHEIEGPLHIKVLGLLAETEVVTNSATVTLEQGKILALSLPLLALCRSTKCDSVVPPGTLPPYTPNQWLDAGARGPEVGIAIDAPGVDARADVASDGQPDAASDSAEDAPVNTGTASTTGTTTTSASATATETAKATGTDTGPGSGLATSTATQTGGTATASSTATTVVTTLTTTTTSTVTGSTNTGTATGTGTGVSRCPEVTANCGPDKNGNGDCCISLPVKGGDFHLIYDGVSEGYDPNYPATVSDFYLDKYEITVGRLRVFMNAGKGKGTQADPPAQDSGAHPKIDGSGWNTDWNKHLAVDTAALKKKLRCQFPDHTWTDLPGDNENKPVNCLDWYTAFAFCTWDGGRLPTEAEWNYAASGGAEQRYFPWSPSGPTLIDLTYAVYLSPSAGVVGSKPKSDGAWGQSDLAGNVKEWLLDWHWTLASPCRDCANLTADREGATSRGTRGGWFGDDAFGLRNVVRSGEAPTTNDIFYGARCARSAR